LPLLQLEKKIIFSSLIFLQKCRGEITDE
jgi:hypothetical protein